jgi:hypothetical protein
MYCIITIQRTVDIPADRRIHLDIKAPDTIPKGRTQVLLSFPAVEAAESAAPAREPWIPLVSWLRKRREERFRRAVMRVAGCLANSPAFEGDPVEVIRKMRDEWAALYPLDRREAINAIAWNHGKKNDSSRVYAGCLKGKNIFKGDPVAIQRKMRDEWQDARS